MELTLQRHFRVLTKFTHVESQLSGRKRQREAVFYAPVNLCDRRPCSTSVAVGLSTHEQSAGRRILRRQQRGAWRRHKAPVLPEAVVCPRSVLIGGAMSNWYRFTCTVAALALTLAFAVTAFADDPGFPAPTGDP